MVCDLYAYISTWLLLWKSSKTKYYKHYTFLQLVYAYTLFKLKDAMSHEIFFHTILLLHNKNIVAIELTWPIVGNPIVKVSKLLVSNKAVKHESDLMVMWLTVIYRCWLVE